MAGDRELPPLRVKLYGDNSQYKEMLKDSEDAANAYKEQVNKVSKKVKVGAPDAEFERIFHNYRLLEKSKEILDATSRKLAKREEDRVFKQEALSAKIAAIEETKAFALAAIYEKMEEMKRKAARKSARAEENRVFSQMQLQEKMLQAEEARVFSQMQLQEKLDAKKRKAAKREEDRLFAQAALQEKMAKLEEDRLFALAALYEKIEARKRKAMAKTAAAEEARVFSNMLLQEKAAKATEDRQFRNMQLQEKAAKIEEDRQFSNYQLLEKSKAIIAKKTEQMTKEANAGYAATFINPDDVSASLGMLDKLAKSQSEATQKVAKETAALSKQAKLDYDAEFINSSNVADSINQINKLAKAQTDTEKKVADHAQKEQDKAAKELSKFREQRSKDSDTWALLAMDADKKVAASTNKQLKDATSAHNKKMRQVEQEQKKVEAAEKAKAKAAEKAAKDAIRAQEKAARASQRSGGYNQFGGLGDRADIYMHANAIRTLIDMSSSFIASSANWQRMSVQLETLTGSAAEATKVMERLRKEALESPYDMQGLMDSARTMMAYGASVDQAQDVTKMLGDVAGGSNEKLSRLSLGMAQIISLGKLQGNELRQLTEHGFNPLRTIAERTLKPMQTMEERMKELNEAKEKGRITSDMVVKALEIETSAGGRFAGMSYRMSQDVWGLTQQIQELVTLIKKRFMDTLLKDTQNALRVVIDFLKKVDAWAQANEELVATIARVVRNVMVAAVVFNMLGMAIAMTKWQLRMASMIFAFFGTVVNTVTGAVRALRIGLIALALNNPVGWIVIAIGAALALGAAIMHPGGPVGAFKAFMAWGQTAVQNVIGFFYNFQENVAIIGAWLSANWGKLFIGMVSMSVRIFTVFMTWLIAYLPMKAWEAGTYFMGKLIDAVSFGLQKLGEMFSFFWANITNPAAILEYLSKFTSTLAGDISTTMSDGLVGGITKVMSEELAALNLPELNLKGPEYKAPAEPTPPDLPTAPDVDFNSMMGPGGGGKAATPVTAVRAGSGEAATMAHQYMMGRAAKRAGGDPQLEVNKEQRDLLRIIAQNTRGTKDDMRLDNAGLVGPQVA